MSIQVDTENVDELIKQIINANKNLTESNQSNDWEMTGKDIKRLQGLIYQLENILEQKESIQIPDNDMVNNITSRNIDVI